MTTMTNETTKIHVRGQLGFWDMVTLRMALSTRVMAVREIYGAGSEMEGDVRRLTESLGLDFATDVDDLTRVGVSAPKEVAA